VILRPFLGIVLDEISVTTTEMKNGQKAVAFIRFIGLDFQYSYFSLGLRPHNSYNNRLAIYNIWLQVCLFP